MDTADESPDATQSANIVRQHDSVQTVMRFLSFPQHLIVESWQNTNIQAHTRIHNTYIHTQSGKWETTPTTAPASEKP